MSSEIREIDLNELPASPTTMLQPVICPSEFPFRSELLFWPVCFDSLFPEYPDVIQIGTQTRHAAIMEASKRPGATEICTRLHWTIQVLRRGPCRLSKNNMPIVLR